MDFLILKRKWKKGCYPLILGRPCLATTTTLINYRISDMTISNGHNSKVVSLYSPAKLALKCKGHLWINEP